LAKCQLPELDIKIAKKHATGAPQMTSQWRNESVNGLATTKALDPEWHLRDLALV
jgi:hypothetical protein